MTRKSKLDRPLSKKEKAHVTKVIKSYKTKKRPVKRKRVATSKLVDLTKAFEKNYQLEAGAKYLFPSIQPVKGAIKRLSPLAQKILEAAKASAPDPVRIDLMGKLKGQVEENTQLNAIGPLPTVGERLSSLGKLYDERATLYGDNYKHFGKVMMGMFPHGLTLETEEEFGRFSLLVLPLIKLTRYSQMFKKGGHVDSLDDTAVYVQMLREIDDEIANKD